MYIAQNGTSYRIADAHTHIYAEKIADKAGVALTNFYDGLAYSRTNPSSEQLIARGGTVGAERYLVCSAATKESQVESIINFIAGECAQHPEFVGMGTAHPDCADFEAVLDSVQERGLKGIKLHPDFQKFNIDDPRMLPLYKEATERGLICMFHVGDNRYDFSAPERLARVLDKVPGMLCHAAHFGCCLIWKRRPLALAGADIMFDTSSTLGWATREEVLYLVEHLGIDHLMWGTDFPLWNHDEELQRFFDLGLSAEDNKKILYDNFAAFYGLEDC